MIEILLQKEKHYKKLIKILDEIVALCKDFNEKTVIKNFYGEQQIVLLIQDLFMVQLLVVMQMYLLMQQHKVKKALEVTKELGGENYVFWGGREGYETLLNTDMKLELDNFARLLQMAVDYAKEIGFTGQFLIEPKPKEPTKHQYDFDTATVLAFLKKI